jgi:hypothetical protein
MYVVVGRFKFRPMSDAEKGALAQRMAQDMPAVAKASKGFRGLSLANLGNDELMTVWHWDSEADWDGAQAAFAPLLQEYVIPNLAGPPDRVGGEVVLSVEP